MASAHHYLRRPIFWGRSSSARHRVAELHRTAWHHPAILGQLADGESWDALLKGYPELTRADIQAALRFAEASVVSSQITELVPA